MTWLQHWSDVLFVHVPVTPEDLAACLPSGLELDTFGGQAYIGLVCFRLKLRPLGLPFVPCVSSLLELNVRTYVRCQGSAGIIFLRMYADNRRAVAAARLLTPLGYETAYMATTGQQGQTRCYDCKPTRRSEDFAVEFTVKGPYGQPDSHSLGAWLVERYRLFVDTPRGLIVGDVDHVPWQIAEVNASSLTQTLTQSFATPAGECVLHHSPGVAATFHPFRPLPTVAIDCHLTDGCPVHSPSPALSQTP
jgi:uncharacterized protein